MNSDAPLIASLGSSLIGASAMALATITLGFSPLICAVAYSLGGSAILILSATSMVLRAEQKG